MGAFAQFCSASGLLLRRMSSGAGGMSSGAGGIRWDEKNLADNAEEAEAAQRTKILEPKTPFHTLEEDGETPYAFPPKAAPARAAGPQDMLSPGMDLSQLTRMAEHRRDQAPDEEDEVEKRQKFEHTRKKHYQTGGLAEMRARAAALDAEEGEEEEEEESSVATS